MSPIGDPMTKKFIFAISDEERSMLDEIAGEEHRTSGDWLRHVIREEHARRFGSKRRKKR